MAAGACFWLCEVGRLLSGDSKEPRVSEGGDTNGHSPQASPEISPLPIIAEPLRRDTFATEATYVAPGSPSLSLSWLLRNTSLRGPSLTSLISSSTRIGGR